MKPTYRSRFSRGARRNDVQRDDTYIDEPKRVEPKLSFSPKSAEPAVLPMRRATTLNEHAAAWFGTPTAPGPLASFSGPAILFDASRQPIAANAMGRVLMPGLTHLKGDIAAAFDKAFASVPQSSHLPKVEITLEPPLTPLSAARGEPEMVRVTLDLDLMPAAGGMLLLGKE